MPINTLESQTAIMTVLTCAITFPAFGAWAAILQLDTEDPADLVGPATLTLHPDDNSSPRALIGLLLNGAVRNGRATARLFPGNGGLIQALPGKGYQDSAARLIALDIANEAGEKIATTSTGLEPRIGIWARRAATAAQQISELCSFLGLPWSTLDDGQIQIGALPATAYAPPPRVLFEDADYHALELDLPGVDLSPGHLIEGQRVDRVVYHFEQSVRHTTIRLAA